MSPRPRALLFLSACAALLATALLLRPVAPSDAPPLGRTPAARASPGRPSAPSDRAALVASARRFLSAFLRYEVGELPQAVERSLRATATSAFATELLHDPPRRSSGADGSDPDLGRISFITVSVDPLLVSVSGTARRSSGPEQLSFVFVLHSGRWLASAPGE